MRRPEELLREKLIHWMVTRGGYPSGLICIEKSLDALFSHDKNYKPFDSTERGKSHVFSDSPRANVPGRRRLDILAYTKCRRGQLVPALIIECKASLNSKSSLAQALAQVIGYNHYIKAAAMAVAASEGGAYIYSSDLKETHLKPTAPDPAAINTLNLDRASSALPIEGAVKGHSLLNQLRPGIPTYKELISHMGL